MSDERRVLVIGGTGKTGRAVTKHLRRNAGVVPVIASRNGDADSPDRVRFDWHDPDSTVEALRRAAPEALYLVAPPRVPDPLAVMAPFLTAAQDLGVRRAVLLGAKPVEAGDPGLGQVYGAVRDAFPEWAVVRPTWFMQDFVTDHYLASMVRDGVLLTAGGESRTAWIDAEDVGATAAVALLGGAARELLLTGPEALTAEQTAAVLAENLGRPIRVEHVPERVLAEHLAATVPEALARVLAHADATWSDDGPTDTVRAVTGRSPQTLSTFLQNATGRSDG